MAAYRIRRVADGMFSLGGEGRVRFNKRGKRWASAGALHLHLNKSVQCYEPASAYEVVAYEETEVGSMSAAVYFVATYERIEARARSNEEAAVRSRVRRAQEQLEQAKAELVRLGKGVA